MKGLKTPERSPLAFTQSWESFLGKLSIPVREELLSAGELCARYLNAVLPHIHRTSANANDTPVTWLQVDQHLRGPALHETLDIWS
jgi:hypothetical protein